MEVLVHQRISDTGKAETNIRLSSICRGVVFPDYRPDGEPGTLKVMMPGHPIAAGLPQTFQMTSTEMYNEPFHVPDPDEVIFEETWELGERFRSGMVWNIGKGKVFYFRPGHETYPVFKQPEALKVLDNAIHWLGR